ncbi:hypothetical protein B0G57_101328 [Trinickia symbiotica]|uniref:Uncharacterized protein n=1 Tax=Trinickia symbiotica TaxID=863227 RepID=A0A2N7X8Q3_9BURK|nr:hypothetical protein [Trinickia symbiotica]PMS37991.1 hypothetical protein C0Z20_04055 [Trinickia symbiotica]PPK47363.1 hypothetical protein B0G57_101328 [Trinickia symbiotica]
MNTCAVDHEVWELLPEETALRQWIMTWYHFAVSEGYVEPEYELDNATAERLEGYFQVGLTPGEGADVIFGQLH